jgi:hypothetical protein
VTVHFKFDADRGSTMQGFSITCRLALSTVTGLEFCYTLRIKVKLNGI